MYITGSSGEGPYYSYELSFCLSRGSARGVREGYEMSVQGGSGRGSRWSGGSGRGMSCPSVCLGGLGGGQGGGSGGPE